MHPMVIEEGVDSIIADMLTIEDQLAVVQLFMNDYINKEQTIIYLTGTQGVNEDCALQRMLNRIYVESNVTSTGGSSFEIEGVDIGRVTTVANLGVTYSSPTKLYGDVPNVAFLMTGDVCDFLFFLFSKIFSFQNDSIVLMDVMIDAELDSSFFNISLGTSNPQGLGETLTDLVGTAGARISIFGQGQDSSLLSQILNGFRFTYDNRNKSSSSSSIPLSIQEVNPTKNYILHTSFFF